MAALRSHGFTLIELVVVLALIALGAAMLTPGLAHTRPNVRAIQCLSNLSQMQAGWRMYASDFNDVMLPNAPLGMVNADTWCGSQSEDWKNSNANTNPAPYLAALLASYVGNQIGLYKCPGDTIPSSNGPRIRSYSMNGQMGNFYCESLAQSYNPGYNAYVKVTELVGALPPAMALVFCEENMCSLDDGYLQVDDYNDSGWPDVPGSYHNGGMGVSFADGHVELHQWVTGALLIPVRFGFGYPSGNYPAFTGGHTNADLVWWKAHTAAPLGQ
ncbi:MAG: prepilin-type N-terminal cleavage/methylation domain-containing protein [Verrucomicrobiota bacterium]